MALVTIAQRVADFIPLAKTKVRALTVQLKGEFDYSGYQRQSQEDMMLKITETNDIVKLLVQENYGGLTEKQIHDTIDFYNRWLELHKVVAANYTDYTMPVSPNIVVPGGDYALASDLSAEIAARAAADSDLSDRITELENNGVDPGEIFPEGFFDNYFSTYTVVFDDDDRLHFHTNKLILDQLNDTDLTNIKGLVNHYLSVGDPGGMHVTQDDRDRWDANAGGSGTTALKIQYFTADGSTAVFPITNGTINQLLFVTLNGHVQTIGVNVNQVGNSVSFGSNIPNGMKVGVYYAEGVTVVDPGSGGGGVYDLSSPTTLTVGGMPAGTNISGRTWQSIIEELVVDYLLPAFTALNSADIPNLVEVGTTISGLKVFTWNISNPGNVQPNSVRIFDVTGATYLANGLAQTSFANDGSESVNIGSITNTSPITRAWRAEAQNTNAGALSSAQKTLQSIYPYFFGKVASGGAAPGASRPAANQSLINGGTKVVAQSLNDITLNFASTSDDYIWFAIPSGSPSKNSWYVNALNNGPIGGSVSPGGNLFPDPVTVSINSPGALWSTVSYKIYISNYQTAAGSITMRN
jgi:hypothetical protein